MNDNHLSIILNHLYGLHSFAFSLTSYGISSTKEYVRKNNLFMQNKAKFQKVKLNVNNVLTRDYEQMDTWSIRTKQSQTNPNKAKLKKAKMNVTSIITVAYENKPPIRPPKKQSQTSKRQKPMQPLLPQRIMKKTAFSASKKQTQNKPKQTQFQSPIFPENLIINPMNRICCVCSFSAPFDSAKMALYTGNWNLNKDGRKKLKLLKYKGLNGPGRMRALTGTLFAHSYLGNIVLTN